MKKLLGIIVLGLLFSGNAYAKTWATICLKGDCTFMGEDNILYTSAETDCKQSFMLEEVEQSETAFKIVKTGVNCKVFNTKYEKY